VDLDGGVQCGDCCWGCGDAMWIWMEGGSMNCEGLAAQGHLGEGEQFQRSEAEIRRHKILRFEGHNFCSWFVGHPYGK
jgi:hypothetical protein